jgi:hypothetical protein
LSRNIHTQILLETHGKNIDLSENELKRIVAHALHPIEEIVDIINNRLFLTNVTLTKEFSSKYQDG